MKQDILSHYYKICANRTWCTIVMVVNEHFVCWAICNTSMNNAFEGHEFRQVWTLVSILLAEQFSTHWESGGSARTWCNTVLPSINLRHEEMILGWWNLPGHDATNYSPFTKCLSAGQLSIFNKIWS